MWLLRAVDTPAGTDWTQVIVTIVITFGVCFGAVMSYLGVRAGRAAKNEAAQTREANTMDHGRVVSALEAVEARLAELRGDITNVGQNVGKLRDQFITHLEGHSKEHPS